MEVYAILGSRRMTRVFWTRLWLACSGPFSEVEVSRWWVHNSPPQNRSSLSKWSKIITILNNLVGLSLVIHSSLLWVDFFLPRAPPLIRSLFSCRSAWPGFSNVVIEWGIAVAAFPPVKLTTFLQRPGPFVLCEFPILVMGLIIRYRVRTSLLFSLIFRK